MLLTIADLESSGRDLGQAFTAAQGLSQMYLDYVNNSQEDHRKYTVEIFGSKKREPGVHASELSKCHRALVYGIGGMERKANTANTDTNMLMRFLLGHAVHAMVQDNWHQIAKKSNGLVRFEDEVKVSPKTSPVAAQWNIRSSCDGIITLCDQNKNPYLRVGLEIKTSADGPFKNLRSPEHDHVEQATLYQKTLDLPLMWLFYYNKNNSNYTTSYDPFLFPFDKKLWEEELEMRIARCTFLAEQQRLPARKEGRHCKWCTFSWTCNPSCLQPKPNPTAGYLQGVTRR